MKTIVIIIVLLVAKMTVSAQSPSTDFRKTTWGMTLAQVKSVETEKLITEKDDLLAYQASVLGMSAIIMYRFLDNRLAVAKYIFTETHTNKNLYIEDFQKINATITEKHGLPKADKELWKNDLYRNDPSQKGFAISLGHLSYYVEWDAGYTKIVTSMNGDNYKINLIVEYIYKAMEDMIRAKDKEKSKSDF